MWQARMMEVRARAPGKIILSGEHAVVHGATAVAAAIDLYTHVSLSPLTHPDPPSSPDIDVGSVVIELKDKELVFSWTIQRLKEMILDSHLLPSSPQPCSAACLQSIFCLVEEQPLSEENIWLSSGLSAFLYLYLSIQGCKPAKVIVTSDLPLGAGLGSSASFCVSLCAAFLASSDVVSINRECDGWLKFQDTDLDLVNRWAFEGEKIIHGKPSGVDNTVITFGNMITFKLGKLAHINSCLPLTMLITNTKVSRNTKALVASVSERAKKHPDAMSAVFDAVDSITNELSSIIQSPGFDDLSIAKKEKNITELMEINQGLLQCMGVSHSSIETVLRTTSKYQLVSKLTGAGGGGCVLTLLPNSFSKISTDKVINELESCGFQCFIASAGGRGLEVCFGDPSGCFVPHNA